MTRTTVSSVDDSPDNGGLEPRRAAADRDYDPGTQVDDPALESRRTLNAVHYRTLGVILSHKYSRLRVPRVVGVEDITVDDFRA